MDLQALYGVAVSGGDGGDGGGGSSFGDGGGAGGGGNGIVVSTGTGTLTVNETVAGGDGGDGGDTPDTGDYNGGGGGAGGNGIVVSSGATIDVSSTVSGGDGGAGGQNGNSISKPGGPGGVGIVTTVGGVTIDLGANVSGGQANGGTGAQANAITFAGNNNTLVLKSGGSVTGNVSAGGTGDTFVLGGDTTPGSSFDLATLGTTYSGFENFAKDGNSTWIVVNDHDFGSGTVKVLDGQLNVGDGTTGAKITTTGDATISSGATLYVDTDGELDLGNLINHGTVTNYGTITDDLTNTSTYDNYGTDNADVAYNSGTITNHSGAEWNGDVADGVAGTSGNDTTGIINNDGTWNGDVGTTGGVGNLGTINTTDTWNGLIVNSAAVNAEGTINGDVENNSGGTFKLTGALTAYTSPTAGIDTFLNNGTLDLNGNNLTIGSLSGTDSSANVTNGAASGTATLTVGGNDTSTSYAGKITDGGTAKTALTKTGTGTLTLSGGNASTYTGGTTINGGTIKLGADESIGDGGLTMGGGTFDMNGYAQTVTSLNGATGNITNNSSTLSDPSTLTVNDTGTDSYGGTITDGTTNTVALVKSGVGTLTLSGGNASTYTGGTTINNGTIQLGASESIGDGGLDTTSGGTFDMASYDQTVTTLDGSAGSKVTNSVAATTSTLTVSGTSSYGGSIQDGLGAVALTKSTGGNLTLTGANTYSGATDIKSGATITAASNTALGATTNGTTVESGGTLALQGNITIGAEALSIDGTGVGGNGALRNVSGNNTYGGTVTLAGDARIQSDTGSTLLLNNATSVTATNKNLTLGGVGDGTISGAITTGTGGLTKDGTGQWTLTGGSTFTGAINVNAGTLEISGANGTTATTTININNGGTLTVASTNANGALSNSAVVTMAGTSNFNDNEDETIARLASASTNATTTIAVGKTLTVGDSTNFQYDGNITGSGNLTKVGSDTFTLTASNGLGGATHIMGGTLALSGSGSLPNSAVTIDANTTFDVAAASTPTVNSLTNNGGTVNLHDSPTAMANDTLTVTNAFQDTNGTINLDIALDDSGADKIVADTFTGNGTTFAFTPTSAPQTIWNHDQLIVDVATSSSLTGASMTGLPSGLFNYSLYTDPGTGDIFVRQQANVGALGGIAGNITIVQSTLGAVVNRPSSPFVGGLAADVPPGYCGLGPWTRFTGGQATASGTTATSDGSYSGSSTVDMNYLGAQFGLDLSCFNVNNSGVDIAVGAIGGYNSGSSSQFVANPASTTLTDFQQSFAGVYATLAKDKLAADIQVRGDFTDFTFNNADISLVDAALHTDRYSVSGSASYVFSLNDSMNLIPTGGFSLSQTSSSTLTFATGDTLTPNDSNSYVGFLGATVNKVIVLPDGATAAIPFVTATVYGDFAPDPTSVFTDTSNNSLELVSDNMGVYGEVSAGVNVVKLLDSSKGGPKQFNASVRADAKFSDRLEGFGITGQARAQF